MYLSGKVPNYLRATLYQTNTGLVRPTGTRLVHSSLHCSYCSLIVLLKYTWESGEKYFKMVTKHIV